MLTASEAWHSLKPNRSLNDPDALRSTFRKLDLDGNGKIDAEELRVALLDMQDVPKAGVSQHMIDAQVEAMMTWADLDQVRLAPRALRVCAPSLPVQLRTSTHAGLARTG